MRLEMAPSGIPEEPASWRDLLLRIAHGDESALSTLYDETKNIVYGVIIRIVPTSAVAEEVAMDVYLQVWRQASRYEQSRGTPFTWLVLLARSRALDRLRNENSHARYSWESFQEGFDIVDSSRSPESLALAKQTKSLMFRILSELPDEQRQVIELSFYEGMSHGEIAEHLRLPLGTVKSRLRAGINRFRQTIT